MRVRNALLVLGMVGLVACSDTAGPGGSDGLGGGGAASGEPAPAPRSDPGSPVPAAPGEGSPAPCSDIPRVLEPVDGPVKGGC
jgi:hypothetical protein